MKLHVAGAHVGDQVTRPTAATRLMFFHFTCLFLQELPVPVMEAASLRHSITECLQICHEFPLSSKLLIASWFCADKDIVPQAVRKAGPIATGYVLLQPRWSVLGLRTRESEPKCPWEKNRPPVTLLPPTTRHSSWQSLICSRNYFHVTRRFITVFTKSYDLTQSWSS